MASQYCDFSYENTLQILHQKYPHSNIYIVRPSHKSMEISLYGEYLDCDSDGNVKSYNPHGNAAHTLYLLLENYICNDPGSSLPVILMGFSRGGLVLNQILIEMGTAVYSDSIMQRVQEIHWLDCGNGVRGMCYPNIENKPASFLRYYNKSLRVFFHITSYLYEETVRNERFYELLSFQHQLETVGISVRRRFYSSEFE